MKTLVLTSLSVALVVSGLSARAANTPAQAAALAALEQKFYQLDHPDAGTNSAMAPAESVESKANPGNARHTAKGSAAQTAPPAAPAHEASVAPTEAVPAPAAPAQNASAQAIALAALERKLSELNHAATQPSPLTNFAAAMPTTGTLAPAREASAAATPVTETPAAETPTARTPAITSAAVAPASAAPAAVVPAPKAAAGPVIGAPSVAAVPPPIPGTVALPTMTPAAAAPAAPTLPSSSPGRVRPTNELTTTTGKIYRDVEVERVAGDGIFISYVPAQGGWAMTKVYFRDLPAQIRRQYEKQ